MFKITRLSDRTPRTDPFRWSLPFVGVVVLGLVSAISMPISYAGKGGKGNGGGGGGGGGGDEDPPPELPVAYEIIWINDPDAPPAGWPSETNFEAFAINDDGTVVGDIRSGVPDSAFVFFYNAGDASGDLLDLNTLGAWYDPSGNLIQDWHAVTARDINSQTQIVGQAENLVTSEKRAYVFDFWSAKFMLLPDIPDVDEGAKGISDSGLIALYHGVVFTPEVSGGYQQHTVGNWLMGVNLFGDVISQGGDYLIAEPNGSYNVENWVEVPHNAFYSINDVGDIGGFKYGSGKGKNKIPGGALRLTLNTRNDPTDDFEMLFPGEIISDMVRAINNQGDIAWGLRGANQTGGNNIQRGFVHHADQDGEPGFGSWNLDDLVINTPASWFEDVDIRPYDINSRDPDTKFGQICGRHSYTNSFLLNPILPIPAE